MVTLLSPVDVLHQHFLQGSCLSSDVGWKLLHGHTEHLNSNRRMQGKIESVAQNRGIPTQKKEVPTQ
jgi:hypothetical protein